MTIAPRRIELPPDPHDRFRVWMLAVMTVLVCLPPLVIYLNKPESTRPAETRLLATSQETWLRQEVGLEYLISRRITIAPPTPRPVEVGPSNDRDGTSAESSTPVSPASTESPVPPESIEAAEPVNPEITSGDPEAWRLPTLNGIPHLDEPPLPIWLHMLAWQDMDPLTATPDQLLARARGVALVMAVVTLLATFWAGFSVGRLKTAALATVILGSSFLFIREMRIADVDTHLLAWVTLATAAGFWAMRPLKPVNWTGRQIVGWTTCGVAIAAGFLTRGPMVLVFVGLPIVAAIIAQPQRRLANGFGLLYASILGAMAWLGWYLSVAGVMPEAGEYLLTMLVAEGEEARPFWYYLTIFLWIVPWTPWLIGALMQPLLGAKGERRRALLIAWLWFVFTLIVLSLPTVKHVRFLIPLLPAAAIMVAQLWAAHSEMATEGQRDRWINWVRIPHWLCLLIASVGLPLFVYYQQDLIEAGLLEQQVVPMMDWTTLAALGAGLLAITALGIWWHFRWRPTHAASATVAWMLVVATVGFAGYAISDHRINDYRSEARIYDEMIQQARLLYFQPSDVAASRDTVLSQDPPNAAMLFYGQRVITPIRADELVGLLESEAPIYLLIARDEVSQHGPDLMRLGFEPAIDADPTDDPSTRRYRLFRLAVGSE